MAITKGILAGAADLRCMYDPLQDKVVGVGHAADALAYMTQGFDKQMNGRYDPLQMIAMRLRTPEGMSTGFQHISVCERPGKVFVFVVAKDQPTIIEDDPILFPSDTLIAALHLLKG